MKVIVSLTSTYERSQLLFYTIQSLMRQTVLPDLILVNLSRGSYLSDSGFGSTPKWLENDVVRVNFTENTGSYRKLLPALDVATSDDLIVTADDDVLYGSQWLETLIKKSSLEPNSIICCRARIMKKNIFGNWQNYSNWVQVKEEKKGIDILPIGAGGICYRKKLIDLNFLKNRRFMEIAPTADDLWFKMASYRKNVDVIVLPEIDNKNIYLKHNLGLWPNYNTKNRRSFLFYFFRVFSMKTVNYFGINISKNDFSWCLICKEFYSD